MTIQTYKGDNNQELVSKADYDKLAFSLYKEARPEPFGVAMMNALDAYEKEQDHVPEIGMLKAFLILRDSIVINDAQVTAAIAEFKAQGVDEFSASEDAKVEKWLSGDEYASYASKVAEDFAANLRAGVKG